MNIEPLESRIAPAATFINSTTATFTDVDGDLVTVKFSKALLTAASVASIVVTSDGPGLIAGWEQLDRIDFGGDQAWKGTNITVTAKPQNANPDSFLDGDGLVNVSEISANGVPLGKASIQGDLHRLVAGDIALSTTGVQKLSVHSLGRFAASATNTVQVTGRLGALNVTSDVFASLSATGVGSIKVGGSWDDGAIDSTQDVGSIKTGGNFAARVTSGNLFKIGTVTIGGDFSGKLDSGGDIGAVKIDRDVRGGVVTVSGTPVPTGTIECAGNLISLKVDGSLLGSPEAQSGRVHADGDIGSVEIGRDVRGDAGESGVIDADGTIGSISLGGSLLGGDGTSNAVLQADGDISQIAIGGSVTGGDGETNARITSNNGRLGSLKVGGNVEGGVGLASGQVFAKIGIGNVTLGGSLLGSFSGTDTGSNSSTGRITTDGAIGMVKIAGDVRGTLQSTGRIFAGQNIGSVSIGGDVIGGNFPLSGGIQANGTISKIQIAGDLIGGDGNTSGFDTYLTGYILADRLPSIFIGGSIEAGSLGGGTTLESSGHIRALHDIGSLTVMGDIAGSTGIGLRAVTIAALGQPGFGASATNDIAIGKIKVRGSISNTQILAGYIGDAFSATVAPVNADAQIGTVTVGGDWVVSHLIAGVQANGDGFGNANDGKITNTGQTGFKDNADNGGAGAISRIAKVIIKGQVLGTFASNDAAVYGIEAQHIVSIRLGGGLLEPLQTGAGNDIFNLRDPLGATFAGDGTGDVRAFEV